MRSIRELYGRHSNSDIYIVGTGTSLRVFPLELLEGKITIGLNQAWKVFETQYAITMMPRLNIPEFIDGEMRRPDITWITKPSKIGAQCTPDEIAYAEQHFFGFENDGRASLTGLDEPSETGRVLEWVLNPHPEKLYLWTSISQSAMNLAANMGARNIILVGCDNGAIGENHHAHDQHTMWKGESPDIRYMQYYEGVAEVRAALRKRGVNVVTMNPFVKIDGADMDFERLCAETGNAKFIHNQDIPRGTTLMQDNARYLKLTRYIVEKNLRHLGKKFRLR
ncbi:hypothetical protein [Methyloversatilis sp.]|uniref:hypothetical protein n=1 Tax=Methyloversatilis sp. TaxID=2569862 RepID=UPI003D26E59B